MRGTNIVDGDGNLGRRFADAAVGRANDFDARNDFVFFDGSAGLKESALAFAHRRHLVREEGGKGQRTAK